PRRWRRLDTMQLTTWIEAEVPRVECGTHGVKQIRVPWAEPGSQFTALFERLAIDLRGSLPRASHSPSIPPTSTLFFPPRCCSYCFFINRATEIFWKSFFFSRSLVYSSNCCATVPFSIFPS